MKSFVVRHPVVSVLLYVLGVFCVAAVLRVAVPALSLDTIALIVAAAPVPAAVVLLTRLGWWREAGFNGPARWRNPHLLLLPAALALAPMLGGLQVPDAATLGFLVLVVLFTAFGEEAMIRGFLLHALLPNGMMRAAVFSSLIFGSLHLGGIIIGKPLPYVLILVVFNVCYGLGYAAVRLRTGTVWPLVATHAVGNLVWQVTGASSFLLVVGINLIFLCYGLFLLRREWLPGRRVVQAPAPATE